MLCGRIIALFLFFFSLGWPAATSAQTVHRITKAPQPSPSLAQRLISLYSPFHMEGSRGAQASQVRSQRSHSPRAHLPQAYSQGAKPQQAHGQSPRRSSQVSGRSQRASTHPKHKSAAENVSNQSTRSMLDKMHVGNLLPSGFFFKNKRAVSQPEDKRPSHRPPRSRYQKRPASPKRPQGNPTQRKQTQRKPSQSQNTQRIPAERPLPVARRSPDMDSRKGELESALSGLLEPQEDRTIEKDLPDAEIAGSRAEKSLSANVSAKSSGVIHTTDPPRTPTATLPKSPSARPTLVKTAPAHSPMNRGPNRLDRAGQNVPLDLRLALQEETSQDTLARHVADATAPRDIQDSHNANQPARANEKTALVNTAQSDPKLSDHAASRILAQGVSAKENEADRTPQPHTVSVPSENIVAESPAEHRPEQNPEINQLRTAVITPTPNMVRSTAPENFGVPENPQAENHANEGPLAEGQDKDGLLFSYQQPMIASHVEGPQRILVGRAADYRIVLRNQGDTAAGSLIATIRIPAWAEVVDATSSRGIVQKAGPAGKAGLTASESNNLQWRIQQLKPGESQTLHVRLVPHRGHSMQLGVSWVLSPVGSTAIVEVQEPKLQMAIRGPDEVLFGKPQRYQLTLSNPGTGIAEQVRIQLVPPGGDASTATSHEIGSLKPGETHTIDLELTAREAGDLQVRALASAAGDLQTEATKHLFCRKPELELDWRGPDSKYAGTEATYYFRVRNSGTAPADPLLLKLKLPAGVKYVEANAGPSFDAQKKFVTWELARLNPQEEKFMQVRCRLDQAGPCEMQLMAQTVAGELQEEKTIETKVIALADLKLEVNDPQGPVPVGESAIYEIRVTNRGTNHAQGVNIVGLFSEGIDPVSVEGAQYSIRDGRVSFRTIKSLPAGHDIVLRILAKATQPGTHLFRAEVVCQDLDIKLSSEETTRFFQDKFHWDDGNTPYMAERKAVAAPVVRR